ncbi:MAG: SMC-Scp complex subunit ScpB [Bacillota bacterium]
MLFSGEIKAAIECLLFVASEPLDLKTISEIAGISQEEARELLVELMQLYNQDHRGVQLVEVGGGYALCTRPQYATYIEKLYRPKAASLSQAALETLAIVAYKQPITRIDIEAIRGVKVDGVLGTLLERRLIQEVGRREGPGRPILYGTNREFLIHFGLNDLSGLPVLEQFAGEKKA